MAVVENQRSLLTESSLCKDHCFESLPSNGFAVVRNQDRSHSASHLTLSTKEAKLPLFNDSPLPAAQEELCISLNYSGPWFNLVCKAWDLKEENESLSLYPKHFANQNWTPAYMCLLGLYLQHSTPVRHSLHNVISPSSCPSFHPWEFQTHLISHTVQEGCHPCSYMQIWTVTYHWIWSPLQESKFSASWESCLGGGR